MLAAVYRGKNDIRIEEIDVPVPGEGEMVVRAWTSAASATRT